MAEESGHNSRYEFEFKVPSLRLCIKVGRGQGDGDIGTSGHVCGDLGLGDAIRET